MAGTRPHEPFWGLEGSQKNRSPKNFLLSHFGSGLGSDLLLVLQPFRFLLLLLLLLFLPLDVLVVLDGHGPAEDELLEEEQQHQNFRFDYFGEEVVVAMPNVVEMLELAEDDATAVRSVREDVESFPVVVVVVVVQIVDSTPAFALPSTETNLWQLRSNYQHL